MDVPVRDFYLEVTGNTATSTPVVTAALERWKVPYFTNTEKGKSKTFWRVDIKHMDLARAAHALEIQRKEAARMKKAKGKTNGRGPLEVLLDTRAVDNEGFTLMQRMANVEQELRTIKTTLEEFVKRF